MMNLLLRFRVSCQWLVVPQVNVVIGVTHLPAVPTKVAKNN
jgi:hypothetical protein